MNNQGLLTIGYSTLANRGKNIQFLKEVENLVVIQNPDNEQLPEFASNISVIELKNRGVAKSRNKVLAAAKTKYLLFGDDDVDFKIAAILRVISYLEAHPDVSIVLTQAVDEDGQLRKSYPLKSHNLALRNSAKAATYEIILRVEDIRNLGITFDENFGAGAKNYLGDEYIFIADALRAGLKGVFLPVSIAQHPSHSSGNVQNSSADVLARAQIFTRVFGVLSPIIRLAFLVKPPRKRFGILNSLRFILGR